MKLFVHKYFVPLTIDRFPAGETLIRIEDNLAKYHNDKHVILGNKLNICITVDFRNNGDLIDMLLLTEAVKRHYASFDIQLSLNIPYLPYARQDRVSVEGESLSVKVIADLINSQNYKSVFCADLHSDVSGALINNLVHSTLEHQASQLSLFHPHAILVSPDAGANKKVFKFAKDYNYKDVVRADKIRDVKTGTITGTKVYSESVGNKDFLILDDICDGGRTFIELAKELKKLTTGKIYLYVTHGIFSKGFGVFDGYVDKIYTSNLMTVIKPINDDFLEII